MSILVYALPIAAALLLIAFFSCLPDLRHGRLPHAPSRRLSSADAVILAVIMLLYGAVAFYELGNTRSPESFEQMEGRTATLSLDGDAAPAELWLFPGVSPGDYEIEVSADGESFVPAGSFQQDYVAVLKWGSVPLMEAPQPVRFVRVRCSSGAPFLGELAVKDAAGTVLPVRCDIPALCDENDTVPEKMDFHNSTYFDEIYHARTAWEHLNGVWPYEISHPPLGKEILSLGVLLFGMTPFGWRFSGTLFGVLMLPVLYLLLKRLFGGREVPALGTVVLAADFMHFTQTRIATIDTYGVFFILLMYLFMWIWLEEEKTWALALCGLSFGLGAASKWTGLYAGLGLGVLWLLHWIGKFLSARSSCHTEADRPKDPPVSAPVLPAFLKNVGLCLVFFVVLPCLIYYFSYLPYGRALGVGPFTKRYLETVLDNQRFMFTYHAGIVAEHPYSSRWYQWLLDIRPILYYLEYLPEGRHRAIAAFLNPALCWGGLLSLFVLLYAAVWRRDRKAAFLLLGYLAQLLPWVLIRRLTFAYHYFPCSVFLVLALGYVFALMREGRRRWLCWAIPFTAVSLGLFWLFYPVLSGAPMLSRYSTVFLKWLPTWPL